MGGTELPYPPPRVPNPEALQASRDFRGAPPPTQGGSLPPFPPLPSLEEGAGAENSKPLILAGLSEDRPQPRASQSPLVSAKVEMRACMSVERDDG